MAKFDEEIDISKLLEKSTKKAGAKNVSISKKGIFDMASNPMISMAIQNMQGKYKLLIFMMIIFLLVGVVSSAYWVGYAFVYHTNKSLLTSAAVISLLVIRRIIKNIKSKKTKKK